MLVDAQVPHGKIVAMTVMDITSHEMCQLTGSMDENPYPYVKVGISFACPRITCTEESVLTPVF